MTSNPLQNILEQMTVKLEEIEIEAATVDVSAIIAKAAQLGEIEYEQQKKKLAKEAKLPPKVFEKKVEQARICSNGSKSNEFDLRHDGLYRIDDYGNPLEQLTSSFTVVGQGCDASNRGYSLVIDVPTSSGQVNQVIISNGTLVADGKEALKQLADAGLVITEFDGAPNMLIRYLRGLVHGEPKLLVESPGWVDGETYITPDGDTIPAENDHVIFKENHGSDIDCTCQGTLQQWQQYVGCYCVGNSVLILSVCVALVGVLLPILGLESFFAHIIGSSSTGKTTGLKVGNSVVGSPKRIKTWRTTDNALESIASLCNHCLLCLDEMGQVSAQIVGDIAYMLAAGQGKQRANRNGDGRAVKSWRVAALSTGEIPLADHIRSGGGQARAGQEVRILDIKILPSFNYGAFETIHDYEQPSVFARDIANNAGRYYGTPLKAFITKITELGHDQVRALVKQITEQFLADIVPPSADGQVHRVAERFALLAAAGELASQWGITGWADGEAIKAMMAVFARWITDRGGIGASEEVKILAQVKYFFQQYGHSRFEPKGTVVSPNEESRVPSRRAGFYTVKDGDFHHYVPSEVFKNEICEGFNPSLVIKVLTDCGGLVPAKKSSISGVVKNENQQSERVYHFINIASCGTNPKEVNTYF